jgi:hypothetical protein
MAKRPTPSARKVPINFFKLYIFTFFKLVSNCSYTTLKMHRKRIKKFPFECLFYQIFVRIAKNGNTHKTFGVKSNQTTKRSTNWC